MTTSPLVAKLSGSAASVGEAVWDGCANPESVSFPHPFTRYSFFDALEKSRSAVGGTGWSSCHLTIEQDGKTLGLMPLYLKSHSQGEYVFDWGWADAFERAGGQYYPKLQASVPFTPVTGNRLLVSSEAGRNAESVKRALLEAGQSAVAQLETSSLHITFLTREESHAASKMGFLLRMDQQFHWENRGYACFREFLDALSSSKRKTLRKERASVAAEGVQFEWLNGSEIRETHWDHFFDFYVDTGSRKWGQPYLTREFFSRISNSMSEQIVLILAKMGTRYIAGALNFMGEGVLYGRNWGTAEFIPFLHFETCYYQAIEFAIAHGLRRVEAGAQGEHKLLRGYMPVPTYSAHYIAHPALRRAVADYLKLEQVSVAENMEALAAQGPYKRS